MCQHNNKIGDNYGMSCQDCGERLEGYGYWAHEKDCLHRFLPVGDTEEVCTYCEMWRRKDNPQRDADLLNAEIEKNGWYELPPVTTWKQAMEKRERDFNLRYYNNPDGKPEFKYG